MIDKICMFLTNKIRKEMPEIDDERAEVINYGLQNIIGEVPKIFIMLGVGYLLGVFKETLITFLLLMPYRGFSGGFHMKTHIGCIITTCTMFCGIAFVSKYIILDEIIKNMLIFLTLMLGIVMIKLYAPADTENVPILSKKERKKKQNLSYVSLIIGLIVALLIKDNTITNILLFGYLVQTFSISRIAYKITNNKYGYEVYNTSV